MFVSTTLAGPGAEAIIGDALRSVAPHVDHCLVAFSGCDEEKTLAAAKEAAPGKVITRRLPWPGRYDHARQAMLDWATSLGASYAVTCDTDERVTLKPDYRTKIGAHPEISVWIAPDQKEGYFKERVLACGRGLRWHGRVCENIDGDVPKAKLDGSFWELDKTPEQHRTRYERGLREARRMIEEDQDDRFKWWRHLGSCLVGVERYDEAIVAFETALTKDPSPEDRAWTTYLLCEQWVLKEQYQRAHDAAALALAQHAGFIPEFGSILAYIQAKAGDLQNASRWAQLVLHTPPDRTRISMRGQECAPRARSVLALAHGSTRRESTGQAPQIGGVTVPITERFSGLLTRAVETGCYEATERALLERVLTLEDRVLELGTGCGYLATVAAKQLGSERVLTVEADPEMEATIRKTFDANGVAPQLLLGAVARDASPRKLQRGEHFWSSTTAPGGDQPAIPLGALVASHAPTVLLCDIEGGEADLCGVPLPGVRAVIVEAHGDDSRAAVSDWLAREGFTRARSVGRTHLFLRAA